MESDLSRNSWAPEPVLPKAGRPCCLSFSPVVPFSLALSHFFCLSSWHSCQMWTGVNGYSPGLKEMDPSTIVTWVKDAGKSHHLHNDRSWSLDAFGSQFWSNTMRERCVFYTSRDTWVGEARGWDAWSFRVENYGFWFARLSENSKGSKSFKFSTSVTSGWEAPVL